MKCNCLLIKRPNYGNLYDIQMRRTMPCIPEISYLLNFFEMIDLIKLFKKSL